MASKNMQNTLKITINDKEIVSNPFDFECMCLIQDAKYKERSGSYNICFDALKYMFKGTSLTDSEFENLNVALKCALCDKVLEIYAQIREEIAETEKNL